MEFGWINVWGAMIVIIMLIPNIIFRIKNPNLKSKSNSPFMILLEQVGRYISMLLMFFPLLIGSFGFASIFEMCLYFIATLLLTITYIIVSILNLKSQSKKKTIILAILQILIFLIAGITLRHWLLVVSAIVFAVGSFYTVVEN